MINILLDKYNRYILCFKENELTHREMVVLGCIRTQTISYSDIVLKVWKTPKWSKKEVFEILNRN